MRALRHYILLLSTIAIASSVQAQFCATKLSDHKEIDPVAFRKFQQKNAGQAKETKSIGITIHIVETIPGAANIQIETLYDELDFVNNYFLFAGLEFFFCGSPRPV